MRYSQQAKRKLKYIETKWVTLKYHNTTRYTIAISRRISFDSSDYSQVERSIQILFMGCGHANIVCACG